MDAINAILASMEEQIKAKGIEPIVKQSHPADSGAPRTNFYPTSISSASADNLERRLESLEDAWL